MSSMSAFAMSVLSVEQALDRDNHRRSTTLADSADMIPISTPLAVRAPRGPRKSTSYFNSFTTICTPDDSDPPTYRTACRQQPTSPRMRAGSETLPGYECSITAEAKVSLNLESVNPLHITCESEWRDVYVALRGTMLSIHRVKDGAMGKLLRTYSLQHAEIGLASDTSYTVLIPNTRLAHLIPGPARPKVFKKDNRLFMPLKQHILRIRVETDQLLFAHPSEQMIHDLITSIGAGIDIAMPIDERNASRQCTVPRRRRRHRQQAVGDVTDPTLIAEQERILQQMYPTLTETRQDLAVLRPITSNDEQLAPVREEDEIDVSAMREDEESDIPSGEEVAAISRPGFSRSITEWSVESRATIDTIYADDPLNFDENGKWQPPHTRTAAQELRYARRCMPVLLGEAIRASDVLICNGQRVKINWKKQTLDDWQLKPPSYKVHDFKIRSAPVLERANSTASDASVPQLESGDDITPLERTLSSLELDKAAATLKLNTASSNKHTRNKSRTAESEHVGAMQGVVYCF